MDLRLEKSIEALEKRVTALEGKSSPNKVCDDSSFTMELVLPEADIRGLHFNETKVNAVFEKKGDWYYSRDILFCSARNVEEDNSKDILTEYLESYDFRECIRRQLPEEIFGEVLNPDGIEVCIQEENQGVKKYNGVTWWYWLAPRSAGSSANFVYVNYYGYSSYGDASSALGCAPAFRVQKGHG
jgi:hypothetical protein